jgi:hypothetical protein
VSGREVGIVLVVSSHRGSLLGTSGLVKCRRSAPGARCEATTILPLAHTNPIESTFASVRHRITRSRNCRSRATFLGLAFKLVQEAEKTWRRLNGVDRMTKLVKGVVFKDEIPVQDNPLEPRKVAA